MLKQIRGHLGKTDNSSRVCELMQGVIEHVLDSVRGLCHFRFTIEYSLARRIGHGRFDSIPYALQARIRVMYKVIDRSQPSSSIVLFVDVHSSARMSNTNFSGFRSVINSRKQALSVPPTFDVRCRIFQKVTMCLVICVVLQRIFIVEDKNDACQLNKELGIHDQGKGATLDAHRDQSRDPRGV